MNNKNNVKIAHIITILCILTVGVLLYYLFFIMLTDFGKIDSQKTRLEFTTNNTTEIGFDKKVTVYTESNVTKISFIGELTVDETAKIIITKNEDNSVVYHSTYSDLKTQPVNFEVDNLLPNTYYTLRFYSEDAKNAHLLLMTDKSLIKSPKPSIQPIKQ